MTDEVLEGAQPDEEVLLPAVEEVSEPEVEVQPPSVTEAGITEDRLQELLSQQREELEEVVSRSVQSIKDRRIGQLETKVDEALAIKDQVDAAGGWDQFLAQAQQAENLEKRVVDMVQAHLLKANVSPAQPQKDWRSEWKTESQEILDAAAEDGITVTREEVNQAIFGKNFQTKGEAYAAVNKLIVAKAKGEAIPTAAVTTEGGRVAPTPEPQAPKPFRQQFDELMAAGKADEARALLDAQWEKADADAVKTSAIAAARAAGLEVSDLE